MKCVDKYCMKMIKLKNNMFTKVHGNIKASQSRYKKDYDKKHCYRKVSSILIPINREVNIFTGIML